MLLLTLAALTLSVRIHSRLSLPFLTAIAGYLPFLMEAQISLLRAFLMLFCWTLILSAGVVWLTMRQPERMAQLIWRSREYTESMLRWIQTGELPEGSAGSVVWVHLKQTLIYCLFALISANFLSLMLGSALLGYMNFYVASVAMRSTNRSELLWMAWNPWSVVRVLAFLYLGIVVSTPALWFLIPVPWRLSVLLFMPGVIGIVADIILKLTLSKRWSARLRTAIV